MVSHSSSSQSNSSSSRDNSTIAFGEGATNPGRVFLFATSRDHGLDGAYLEDGRRNAKIIQGGGYYVDQDAQVQEVHAYGPINNEFKNSNVRGTISMAKTSDPNSATSEWFVNLVDNPGLDTQNGGFTVFGRVVNSYDARSGTNLLSAVYPCPTQIWYQLLP